MPQMDFDAVHPGHGRPQTGAHAVDGRVGRDALNADADGRARPFRRVRGQGRLANRVGRIVFVDGEREAGVIEYINKSRLITNSHLIPSRPMKKESVACRLCRK